MVACARAVSLEMKRSGWIGERFWKYGRSRKICLWIRQDREGKKHDIWIPSFWLKHSWPCLCHILWGKTKFGEGNEGRQIKFCYPCLSRWHVPDSSWRQTILSPLYLSSPSHHLLPGQLQWSLSFCFCPLPVHPPQSNQSNLLKTKSDHVNLLPKSLVSCLLGIKSKLITSSSGSCLIQSVHLPSSLLLSSSTVSYPSF